MRILPTRRFLPLPATRPGEGELLLGLGLRLLGRGTAGGVVLRDQRLGISPDGPRDGPDVPAGVEVTTASGVVIALDVLDERLPDTGPLAHFGDGEAGPAARLRQSLADAHGTAPSLDRTARRPDCRVPPVMTPSWPLCGRDRRSGVNLGRSREPRGKLSRTGPQPL